MQKNSHKPQRWNSTDNPSPSRIRKLCLEIQATWTPAVEAARRHGIGNQLEAAQLDAVTFPHIGISGRSGLPVYRALEPIPAEVTTHHHRAEAAEAEPTAGRDAVSEFGC